MRGHAEAVGRELSGLIVHEGDEGADDEGGTAAGDGGKLVTERFAGSGGHDQEDVAASGGGAADGFLVGAEGGEAEGALEQGGEVGHCSEVSRLVSHGRCSFVGVTWVMGGVSRTRRFVDGKWVTVLYIQILAHDKRVTALYILSRFEVREKGCGAKPCSFFDLLVTYYFKDSRLTITHLLSDFGWVLVVICMS
jgi:hypothetical protein